MLSIYKIYCFVKTQCMILHYLKAYFINLNEKCINFFSLVDKLEDEHEDEHLHLCSNPYFVRSQNVHLAAA